MQADNIHEIKETLVTVGDALRSIAVQNERLDNSERRHDGHDKALDLLFERQRQLDLIVGKDGEGIRLRVVDELKPLNDTLDKLTHLLQIVTSRPFIMVTLALVALTVTGSIADVAYHSDLVKKLWAYIPR